MHLDGVTPGGRLAAKLWLTFLCSGVPLATCGTATRVRETEEISLEDVDIMAIAFQSRPSRGNTIYWKEAITSWNETPLNKIGCRATASYRAQSFQNRTTGLNGYHSCFVFERSRVRISVWIPKLTYFVVFVSFFLSKSNSVPLFVPYSHTVGLVCPKRFRASALCYLRS